MISYFIVGFLLMFLEVRVHLREKTGDSWPWIVFFGLLTWVAWPLWLAGGMLIEFRERKGRTSK